jgi:hypothetical protein
VKIEFQRKVVYFADTPYEGTIESEYFSYIKPQHEKCGLFIKKSNIKFTEELPLKEYSNPIHYDLLIFDWGGLSIGNSMLENFCREILEEAEECPNRLYVMASKFTSEAMKDMIDELDDMKKPAPPNVFLNFKELVNFLKKHGYMLK